MDLFKTRSTVIQLIFAIVFVIYGIRLFYIQVVDDTYEKLASSNVIRKLTIYPSRGLVYDRNNQLIVTNEAVYDIMAIPNELGTLDTTLFCSLLKINKKEFETQLAKATKWSERKPSAIVKQISAEQYARFQEYLYQFKGFYPQVRTIRSYLRPGAAHSLGYIGEVNNSDIRKHDGYYRSGDFIGRSGIEASYEEYLRGSRGVKQVLVDVHNREQGSFNNGAADTAAVSGRDLLLSLDFDLQLYAERLMNGKRGSVVAIEPATGEILVLVSSPSYDPNMMTGRDFSKNYIKLKDAKGNLLFNRAIMAEKYPPGSTFKPLMALIGLQEGVITEHTTNFCGGAYKLGGLEVGCLSPGTFNVRGAIERSCNSFFCFTYQRVIEQKALNYNSEAGYIKWKSYLEAFNLGKATGIDIPNEGKGSLPETTYYDKLYGKGRWKSSTTISLSIGQGELGVSPLQLANYFAAIANRGYYIQPHLVKDILGHGDDSLNFRKSSTPIDAKNIDIIVDGLERVVKAGSGRVAALENIIICGKTGTAENPLGADHSFFASFAPKENPEIVVVALVENSGYGSAYAAPIASLLIETYLTDSVSKGRKWLEDRMLTSKLIEYNLEEEVAE